MQKAVLYSFAAAFAGLVSGGVLGLAGRFVPLTVRIAAASLLGLAAIIVALLELNGRSIRPIQCNRETPQSWVHKGPIKWAIQNGLALGCGVTVNGGEIFPAFGEIKFPSSLVLYLGQASLSDSVSSLKTPDLRFSRRR